MAASNVAIIYNATAIILTPNTALRRVVLCDNDSQLSASDGPCKINLGEVMLPVPVNIYNTFSSEIDAVNYVVAHL